MSSIQASLPSRTSESTYFSDAFISRVSIGDEEQALIQACINGNHTAQYTLYKRYASKMFSICLRYAPDYHTAEDLLQDGFIKIYSRLGQYQQKGHLSKWMQRIFVNLAIDRYQKSIRSIAESELTTVDVPASNMYNALDKLEHEDLLKAVQALPSHYRLVFNLYALEGHTHEEVADLLQISKGTSKSYLSRARHKLQLSLIKGECN